MNTHKENQIVRKLVTDLLRAGYRLSISYERGFDTESMLLASTSARKVLEWIRAVDDCHVFIHSPGDAPPIVGGRVNCLGWVFLVGGNGVDVIADYSVRAEPMIEGALQLAVALDEAS